VRSGGICAHRTKWQKGKPDADLQRASGALKRLVSVNFSDIGMNKVGAPSHGMRSQSRHG
jgi:hypothetical protein